MPLRSLSRRVWKRSMAESWGRRRMEPKTSNRSRRFATSYGRGWQDGFATEKRKLSLRPSTTPRRRSDPADCTDQYRGAKEPIFPTTLATNGAPEYTSEECDAPGCEAPIHT